jgi:hypothetical protein
MKTKVLAFAFFYFSDSGLFNGVSAISNRKIPVSLGGGKVSVGGGEGRRSHLERTEYSADSDFRKKLLEGIVHATCFALSGAVRTYDCQRRLFALYRARRAPSRAGSSMVRAGRS